MRFAVAILVVALFGAITANKALFKELHEINKHPFGATMLAAISTNLRAKTPLSDVSDLLNKILGDLQADSQTLDKTYESTKESLENSIAGGNNLIENINTNIAFLQDAIKANEEEGVNQVNAFNENTEALDNARAELEATNADYETQTTNFDEDIANLNAAIQASNAALDRLNTFKSATGAALVQVASSAKSHLKSFSKIMKDMSKKLAKHGSMYAPLIHELVELTSNVDEDKVGTVVDLLNQLINLFQSAIADLQAQKGSYVAGYDNKKSLLEQNIATFEQNIESAQNRLGEIGDQLISFHGDLDQAESNLEDAQNSLAQSEAALKTTNENYNDQRPRYDNLLAILKKLIQHFEENVAAVDEWTASQLNGEI
jgi:chromosome segregation ATPase